MLKIQFYVLGPKIKALSTIIKKMIGSDALADLQAPPKKIVAKRFSDDLGEKKNKFGTFFYALTLPGSFFTS